MTTGSPTPNHILVPAQNGTQKHGLPSETLDFAHRMFDAARSGDLSLLSSAIEAGLPVNLTNSAGNTLLMLAAYGGGDEVVSYLLSKGADVNRLNDRGQSPLSGSVFKGFRPIVEALVNAGADPKAGQPNAIDCAYMFGKTEYWSLFEATEADLSPDVPRSIASHRGQ